MYSYVAILAIIFLTSCGSITSESVYEGIRSQQKAKNAGIEPKQPALPSYQQYEKERDALKN